MCQIELNKLVATGMIRMNQAIEITPTVIGEIMAKYYVAFETMKLFTQVNKTSLSICLNCSFLFTHFVDHRF